MEFELNLMPSAAGVQLKAEMGAVAPGTQHTRSISVFRVSPAFGGVGSEDVTLHAVVSPAGAVGVSFAGSGFDTHSTAVTGLFEGVITPLSINIPVDAPSNFLDWNVAIVAKDAAGGVVSEPLTLSGSTSRFRVVGDSPGLGGATITSVVDLGQLAGGTLPDTPVFITNLTNAPITLHLSHTSTIVSLGVFRTSCNKTQPNVSILDLTAHETAQCRLVPLDTLTGADIGTHTATVTVTSSTSADLSNADTQSVSVYHEVQHDLSQEGAIYSRQVSTVDLLAQRMHMGPASIFYDNEQERLRLQVGQRDVDFRVDSVDTVRSQVADMPETFMRVVEDTTNATGGRALEIVNDSNGIVETLFRVGADGKIRIKSGVLITQNPAIPNVHEFSLNVAPKNDGTSALEVRDVGGNINFDIQENANF